ncbi:hypothetical protein JL722_8418 [Aureococcus anophagefferens]|nr:hypothetical protein JL722_8418 [Aureococcus anophagefferens]
MERTPAKNTVHRRYATPVPTRSFAPTRSPTTSFAPTTVSPTYETPAPNASPFPSAAPTPGPSAGGAAGAPAAPSAAPTPAPSPLPSAPPVATLPPTLSIRPTASFLEVSNVGDGGVCVNNADCLVSWLYRGDGDLCPTVDVTVTSDAGDIVAVKQSARSGGAVTLQPSTNAPTAPLRPFDIRETKRRSSWGDRFGETVALVDARLVAAGAWGYAYVHNSSDGGLTWTQERVMDGALGRDRPRDRPWPGFDESFFGCAVALAPAVDGSGDADLVVGTCGNEDTGAADVEDDDVARNVETSPSGPAYVYRGGRGAWTLSHALYAAETDRDDAHGQAVALAGDLCGVGAWNVDNYGAVYVYSRSQNYAHISTIESQAGSADRFGEAFGFSRGGSAIFAAVGAPSRDVGDDMAVGYAYVFASVDAGASWTHTSTLTARKFRAFERFGLSVAVAEHVVVVGGRDDAIYLFRREDGGDPMSAWTLSQTIENIGSEDSLFGSRVAVDAAGSLLAVGAMRNSQGRDEAGAVFVFQSTDEGRTWARTDSLKVEEPEHLDFFGASVAVSPENVKAVVAGGTQYEYLAGKITSTGPGFADFARVQLTSSGVILADDATGANGDALGRAVAVGGSWTWVHARTTAGPAAVAVAGDLVFVSEDGGPAVALAVDGFAEVSRFESAAAGGAAVAAATFGLQGRSYLLATTGGRELVCYEMTAPSSATFGEWNETSIANDGADDGRRRRRDGRVSDDGATGPGFAETFVAYPPDRYVASCVEFKSSSRLQCRVRERRRHARPAGPRLRRRRPDDDGRAVRRAVAGPDGGAGRGERYGGERGAARRRLSTESVDYAAAFNADETNGATFCAAVRLAAPSATGVEGCCAAAAAASATNHRVRVTYAVVFDTFALDDVDVFVNASLAAVKTEVAASMESGAFAAYLASEAAYRNASGDAAVLVLDVDVDRSVANVDALVLADVELSVATFSPTARPTGEEEDDDAFDEFVYVIYGAVLLLALTSRPRRAAEARVTGVAAGGAAPE